MTWLFYVENTSQAQDLAVLIAIGVFLSIVLSIISALIIPLVLIKIGKEPELGSPVLLTFISDVARITILFALVNIIF